MKREIKFRAWNGRAFQSEIKYSTLGLTLNGHAVEMYDSGCETGWNYRDGFTLMQFTGLKDKNGVEIYEGDILQFKRTRSRGFHCSGGNYDYEGDESFKAVVEFQNGGFELRKANCYPFESRLSHWQTMYCDGQSLLNTLSVHVDRIGGEDSATYTNPEVIGNIYQNPELL